MSNVIPSLNNEKPIWWGSDRTVLSRVMADLIHSELFRIRLGDTGGAPPWLWTAATGFGPGSDLAIDSLDRMSLSSAVAELIPGSGFGLELMQANSFGAWCECVANAESVTPMQVTFRSSGSMGTSKSTIHSLACLEAEAISFAALLGPGRKRILSAIPSHHAYGFIHSVLLPGYLGEVQFLDLRGSAPCNLALILQPGDLVLGHPAFWEAALRGIAGPLPDNVIGITSSAHCPMVTASGLLLAGLTRLLQIYGTSETAGIGWRDDPSAPYELLPGWQRDGDNLVQGLRSVALPDRLQWDNQDRFRVLERRDRIKQVGGINVDLDHVRTTLLAHSEVADVAVRAMRPDEGHRLKAFVVPRTPMCNLRQLRIALRQFSAATLTPVERPGSYTFGIMLPQNELGKMSDWLVDIDVTEQQS